MRYRYVLVSGILSYFTLASSVWAGAGDGLGADFERATRETQLPHVCNGGPDHGKTCAVIVNNNGDGVVVKPPGCSGGGQCVVKYTSSPIPCRLSLHADAELLPENATVEPFETLTVTLVVKQNAKEHFFSNTVHLPRDNNAKDFAPETFERLITESFESDLDKYLFRETNKLSGSQLSFPNKLIDPDDSIGDGLRALFNKIGRPVISTVGERIVESDHSAPGDPLASLVVLYCELRFVPFSRVVLPPPVITQ
jgi:hypothetical protein